MLGVAQLINEAWTHETGKDNDVALRLYKTAYNNLLDINGQVNANTMTNFAGVTPFEIRSVADYVNYRFCHIQFIANHPREAITQFKKHVDTYKQHTKSPEYAFEHSAWLSQQYIMFADLFQQAVSNGVKASKAQHPGCYYYEAVVQMIERRRNTTLYTNDEIRSNQMPVTNELLSMITTPNFVSFLRQCGWTCIQAQDGPPVAPTSQVQPVERDIAKPINHSDVIIRAAYRGIDCFEESGRQRMQKYLAVLAADEFLLSGDLTKSQTLYNIALNFYEKEGWTPLVDSLKEKLAIIDGDLKT